MSLVAQDAIEIVLAPSWVSYIMTATISSHTTKQGLQTYSFGSYDAIDLFSVIHLM